MPSNQAAIDYSNPREVIVTFVFSKGWQIVSPDAANGFPGGGGLEPPAEGALNIRIAPLDLAAMSGPQALASIAKRTVDLGNVAQALALAQLEFADIIKQYTSTSGAD